MSGINMHLLEYKLHKSQGDRDMEREREREIYQSISIDMFNPTGHLVFNIPEKKMSVVFLFPEN